MKEHKALVWHEMKILAKLCTRELSRNGIRKPIQICRILIFSFKSPNGRSTVRETSYWFLISQGFREASVGKNSRHQVVACLSHGGLQYLEIYWATGFGKNGCAPGENRSDSQTSQEVYHRSYSHRLQACQSWAAVDRARQRKESLVPHIS